MFWGAMTYDVWGPLTVCDGTINGTKYLPLLKDVVLPEFAFNLSTRQRASSQKARSSRLPGQTEL